MRSKISTQQSYVVCTMSLIALCDHVRRSLVLHTWLTHLSQSHPFYTHTHPWSCSQVNTLRCCRRRRLRGPCVDVCVWTLHLLTHKQTNTHTHTHSMFVMWCLQWDEQITFVCLICYEPLHISFTLVWWFRYKVQPRSITGGFCSDKIAELCKNTDYRQCLVQSSFVFFYLLGLLDLFCMFLSAFNWNAIVYDDTLCAVVNSIIITIR